MSIYTLTCKWNGKDYPFEISNDSTLEALKAMVFSLTGVLPERQKILGIPVRSNTDESTSLMDLKVKNGQKFRMMGSKEEAIANVLAAAEESDFVVVDDLDWDYSAEDCDELHQDAEAQVSLQKAIEKTKIHTIVQPRPGKKLLVLDLDHTLLHFNKDHTGPMHELKRPHMDQFLTSLHEFYDFAVWSQTSWRWLELKLTQLGIITNPNYRINFVLDKTSMFKVKRKYKGKTREHYVKPLEIIWNKYEQWDATNTVHLDDLSRNFAMNPQNGLKCSAYKRRDIDKDYELLELGVYLKHIAQNFEDFSELDHNKWKRVLKQVGKHYKREHVPNEALIAAQMVEGVEPPQLPGDIAEVVAEVDPKADGESSSKRKSTSRSSKRLSKSKDKSSGKSKSKSKTKSKSKSKRSSVAKKKDDDQSKPQNPPNDEPPAENVEEPSK